MKISRVGVDLAKNVFQIHGTDAHGKTVWKRKLTREKWIEAICEAMSRPNMRFVKAKSVEQQDIQATHRVRSELMCQRIAKMNQIRGLVAEYGY